MKIKFFLSVISLMLCFQSFSQMNEYKSLYHVLNSTNRDYIVHLPTGYDTSQSLPLIINMHGLGGTNNVHMGYSEFNQIADTGNFIVVYPQGLVATTSWGQTDEQWDAYYGSGTKDLEFLDTLIDQMFYDYNIDLTRVYSTGHSNGGYMSYRLACELSERIAAIASVGGAMTYQQEGNCNLTHPMPIMQIHGTADATVPWNGISMFNSSIPDLITFWRNKNNCNADSVYLDYPDINLADSCFAYNENYNMCDSTAEVVLITVENGGHSWPGAVNYAPLGNTCQDFHASSVIWNFFNKHTLENPIIPESLIDTVVQDTTDTTGTSDTTDTLAILIKAQQNLVMAPNPFGNQLYVKVKNTSFQDNSIQLINSLGEVVVSYSFDNELYLNTEKLNSGLYFVILNGVNAGKIVKQD